jgi:hypothetical protein
MSCLYEYINKAAAAVQTHIGLDLVHVQKQTLLCFFKLKSRHFYYLPWH